MTYKYTDIDGLYFAISRITTHSYKYDKSVDDKWHKFGTGFFYDNGKGGHFLITNRHNIIIESDGYHPNVLRVYLHTDEQNITINEPFDIPLYKGAKKLWREPVQNYDVVLIPLPNHTRYFKIFCKAFQL